MHDTAKNLLKGLEILLIRGLLVEKLGI